MEKQIVALDQERVSGGEKIGLQQITVSLFFILKKKKSYLFPFVINKYLKLCKYLSPTNFGIHWWILLASIITVVV